MWQTLFDIWYYIRSALRLADFTILNVDSTNGTISYTCNNRTYKTTQWPITRRTGISLPIEKATLVPADGSPEIDVTDQARKWAGPRSDFYGTYPRVHIWGWLPRVRLEWPEVKGDLKVKNIIGQESIFAAK
jgi:hypothetical protein